jgi:hypothetical protein
VQPVIPALLRLRQFKASLGYIWNCRTAQVIYNKIPSPKQNNNKKEFLLHGEGL